MSVNADGVWASHLIAQVGRLSQKACSLPGSQCYTGNWNLPLWGRVWVCDFVSECVISVETYMFVRMKLWMVTRHHQILKCPQLGLLKCKFPAPCLLTVSRGGGGGLPRNCILNKCPRDSEGPLIKRTGLPHPHPTLILQVEKLRPRKGAMTSMRLLTELSLGLIPGGGKQTREIQ